MTYYDQFCKRFYDVYGNHTYQSLRTYPFQYRKRHGSKSIALSLGPPLCNGLASVGVGCRKPQVAMSTRKPDPDEQTYYRPSKAVEIGHERW